MKKLSRMILAALMATMMLISCMSFAAAEEPITLRVYDWSDSTRAYRDKFHEEFMANNPDIIIEYTQLTIDQFNSTVVQAIIDGTGPDLFPVPTTLNLTTAVNEGWFLPLEDYLPQEFLDTFLEGTLAEGVQRKNGVLYTLPESGSLSNSMFFYNKDILAEANVEVPKTFEDFRAACKTITEKGAGQYYGLIEGGNQGNRCDILLRALIQAAGGKISINSRALTVNGKVPYDTEEVKAAVELLQGIVEDGSLYPDTASISAPEARELFAQGKAAFLCQGLWCIGTWANDHPELNYGVMTVPKGADNGYTANVESIPWMGIYAKSAHPEAAARYLQALYDTETYHYQADVVKSGSYVSVIKGVNEANMVDPVMKEYYEAASQCIDIPIATSRDVKFYDFYSTVVSATPSLASIAQGILSQAIDSPMDYLTMLTNAETAAWQAACQQVGVDFAELEFSNWVAGQPYTDADYAALQ
ncbi:MAG: extracellular solute-binding protein [Clostridia bacterium]|nr:extracellular solute-binding protein [Clostridia bacterium]